MMNNFNSLKNFGIRNFLYSKGINKFNNLLFPSSLIKNNLQIKNLKNFSNNNNNNSSNQNQKNFIKKKSEDENFETNINKENINKNYDYTKHSLLNNLYMFNYNADINPNKKQKSDENLVYFLIDPATKSIIAFDLFIDIDFPEEILEELSIEELLNFTEKHLEDNLNRAKNILNKLEFQTKSKLNYIFLTKFLDREMIKQDYSIKNITSNLNSYGENFYNYGKEYKKYKKLREIFLLKNKFNKDFWLKHNPNTQIISGSPIPWDKNSYNLESYSLENNLANKYLNDIETLTIGEICFAALLTQGIHDDQYSFVVTHVTESSTKIPFLFSGEVLSIGFPGSPYILNRNHKEKLLKSLNIFSTLPNDTLVYPRKNCTLSNFEILKKIDSENFFIDDKLNWAKEMKRKNENAVGSRIIEEKFYNPAYRLDDEVIRKILGENETINVKFGNLISLKEKIDEQIRKNMEK